MAPIYGAENNGGKKNLDKKLGSKYIWEKMVQKYGFKKLGPKNSVSKRILCLKNFWAQKTDG